MTTTWIAYEVRSTHPYVLERSTTGGVLAQMHSREEAEQHVRRLGGDHLEIVPVRI